MNSSSKFTSWPECESKWLAQMRKGCNSGLDSLWHVFPVHFYLVFSSVFCNCIFIYWICVFQFGQFFFEKELPLLSFSFHGDCIESHTNWACQVVDTTMFKFGCYLNRKHFFPPQSSCPRLIHTAISQITCRCLQQDAVVSSWLKNALNSFMNLCHLIPVVILVHWVHNKEEFMVFCQQECCSRAVLTKV